MKWVVLIIVVIGALALLRKIAELKGWIPESGALPYFKKKTLLNEKEQVLFLRLIEAMPAYYVMAQVRLADIVGVSKCENSQSWQNKINQKSIDFVICDKSFSILVCIELDGKTHEQLNRKKADSDKDAALEAAGIPLVRIEPNKLPSVDEIRKLMAMKLMHKNSKSSNN